MVYGKKSHIPPKITNNSAESSIYFQAKNTHMHFKPVTHNFMEILKGNFTYEVMKNILSGILY